MQNATRNAAMAARRKILTISHRNALNEDVLQAAKTAPMAVGPSGACTVMGTPTI